ncbi:MAG: RNA-directed DNA polymerase [Bacteroidetes bacterium]|nr:RNA-directed DNA polymerase [Bacteroidota bacterium]
MKLEQAHIDQIATAFKKMQSKEDLLQLLNEAKPLVYGEKAVPFELKQLTWYSNPKLGGKRYAEFKIKKKSGTDRSIHAPVKGLKSLQKTLSFVLQCVFEPHRAATGFVRDKSIVDNARLHEASKYVYNIDLKDFFPSVDQARVWKCLQLKPFNLTDSEMASEEENTTRLQTGVRKFITDHKERIYYKIQDNSLILVIDKKGNYRKYKRRLTGHLAKPNAPLLSIEAGDREKLREYNRQVNEIIFEDAKRYILSTENIEALNRLVSSRKNLANIIASLCCTEMEVERKNEIGEWEKVKRNVLPQGASTSPVITNIVCQRLDHLLSGVARRFGLKYSRYADDITFSSMHNVYQPESEFLKELHRIILEQGFHIKESKTRLQKDGYRKEVTGLLVNEKANVQQRYIKQLRMWLYYWERYGFERASSFFLQEYLADKGYIKKGKPDMANVIAGKLDYLKMVKGNENPLYLKLKTRFTLLTATNIKDKQISEEAIITQHDSNQVKITLEVYPSSEINQKLNNEINIPKHTTLPSTIIVPNSVHEFEEDVERQEENKLKRLFPHNPMYTISFLKKFKIGDGSGFKELVHDVILSDETIQDILKKVKSHPNFIYHFKKEWVSDVSYLNGAIQKEVIKLIDLFEKDGISFYKNSHKHPFNNDSKFTNYAKQFKKKYRYGSGSEYSKLQSDIINIFKDQRVPQSSLSFMPDERKFNIRSSFFTWQPSIYNGIRYIVQGIRDHSNINGMRPANLTEKKIFIEIERIQAESLSFIELRIFDCRSIAKIDSTTLLHFLQESSPFKFDFRNLCDWIVECDFTDESSKRINLLTAPEFSQSFQEIEDLSFTVGGFKHILRFYDAR